MSSAELWLIAGPNGAGKTTLAQRSPISDLLHGVALLNPDNRTSEILRERGFTGFADAPTAELTTAFVEAAGWVSGEIESRLQRGEAVCVETVLSRTNIGRRLNPYGAREDS